MAEAPSIKIECRLNRLGRVTLRLSKLLRPLGLVIPRRLATWLAERSVECRVDGERWGSVRTKLARRET